VNLRIRVVAGALFALGSPLAAAVVVESVRAPAGAVSPLREGDVVLRWRSVGAEVERAGELAHWGDLEVLPLVEGPRGPLEIELVRDGERRRETIAPAPWAFRDRPAEVEAPILELVGSFAAEGAEIPAAELASRLAGTNDEVASWVWARYAEALARRGGWQGAIDAYAMAAAGASGPIAAELERALGNALRRLGRSDDAEAAYRRALARWQRLEPGGLGVSIALNALGTLATGRYELAEANRLYLEATHIRRTLAPDSWIFAAALNNLGVLAGRRNDLAAAEDYFLEALAINERVNGEIAQQLANLGIVARLRGDLERSEMYTRRALELYRGADARLEVGDKLINLGNVLGDAGRWDESIAAYTEAQAIFERGGSDVEARANAIANRAHVLQLRGDFAAAARDAGAARELLGFDRPRTSLEAYVTEILRDLAEALDDLDEAARWAELSLEARARIQPDSSLEALAASALARIRARQGRPDEAEALFRRSIGALERQQGRLGGGDRGLVAFRAKHASIYRDYVDFLLRAGRVNDAFELYERSRASALLALLGQRDLDFSPREIAPELAGRRRELALRLDGAYASLARLPADADAERLRQRQALEQLHAERDALDRRIRAESARVAAAEAPPTLGLEAIRAALPPGTLLLAYQLGRESSTLFSLTREGGLEAHAIATGEEAIGEDVHALLARLDGGLLARRERAAIEARLSRTLLAPVAARLDAARRLLVVPDGALHSLSFAALPDPREAGRRLVEELPVTRQVSASVFAALQERAEPAAVESVAVFADPTTDARADALYRRDFGRLPAARREADLVRSVFPDRTHVFVDRRATEAAARRELASATIAHFACHAAVDADLPLDSSLVLSADAGDEGLLQAWEIAEQVEVESGLVVLSACETARGAERGGEGILGLVRAFQVAGARSVLASLWRVDDESAAELMGRFYAGLAAGLPRDEALRRAQLELLDGPIRTVRNGREIELDASDPRHWAPFVLIGPVD